MDSLNSWLLGFYTLLLYSYSQRHTHTYHWVVGSVTLVHPILNGVSRGKTDKKNGSSNFFLFFSNQPFFLILYSLSSKYICTRTYFVFVLSVTLRGGTYLPCRECGSRLRKRLSSKGIPLSSHSCIWYTRPVLFCVKANYSLTSEVQDQRHRTHHIHKKTSQFDIPTSLTPALIHLLCFHFVGCPKEVSNLTNCPVVSLLGTRVGSTSAEVVPKRMCCNLQLARTNFRCKKTVNLSTRKATCKFQISRLTS